MHGSLGTLVCGILIGLFLRFSLGGKKGRRKSRSVVKPYADRAPRARHIH